MTTSDRLQPNERGTRLIAGKPYHYQRVDGQLRLVPGTAPEDPQHDLADLLLEETQP